jgi:hypothetical protein
MVASCGEEVGDKLVGSRLQTLGARAGESPGK